MSPEAIEAVLEEVWAVALRVVPTIGLALLVAVVGSYAVNKVLGFVHAKLGNHSKVDPLICKFGVSTAKIGLKSLLGITVLSMLNIDVTSALCLLSVAALAFGMAVTQVLENFIGGIVILLRRPYSEGDLVELQHMRGRVAMVTMFSTQIRTLDNKLVIIPNAVIAKHEIVNLSALPNMRLDVPVKITHDSDVDKALEEMLKIAEVDDRVEKLPEPQALVAGFADLGIELTLRCWVSNDDYSVAHFALNKAMQKAFNKAGVNFARHGYRSAYTVLPRSPSDRSLANAGVDVL